MTSKSTAFFKGGCGCLLAFLAIGMALVLFGGHMHIDPGGAILLFVIGGVIGLIVLAIYNKGVREGRGNDRGPLDGFDQHGPDDRPPGPGV